jgi:hypothetical protein
MFREKLRFREGNNNPISASPARVVKIATHYILFFFILTTSLSIHTQTEFLF